MNVSGCENVTKQESEAQDRRSFLVKRELYMNMSYDHQFSKFPMTIYLGDNKFLTGDKSFYDRTDFQKKASLKGDKLYLMCDMEFNVLDKQKNLCTSHFPVEDFSSQ